MREIKDILKPEIEVFHTVNLSLPTIVTVAAGDITDGMVKAGAFLKAATGTILSKPTEKTSITKTAGEAQGILMHDIDCKNGAGDYAAGVILAGYVYDDAIAAARGIATDAADVTALEKQGILFLGHITLKK